MNKKLTTALMFILSSILIFAFTACTGGSTKKTITFDYNYEGAPTAITVDIESGTAVSQPVDPVREGYSFDIWYMDAECNTPFDFSALVKVNKIIYAGWIENQGELPSTTYTFEAEHIDFTGLEGPGYSGDNYGVDMIDPDVYEAGASNGYYVTYLYADGVTLTFNIESDGAVDNAILYLRLSAENMDITINDENYLIIVNGTSISFDDIEIENVPSITDGEMRPFTNHRIGEICLIAGTNVIELVTNNNISMGGTMAATAPVVDCIRIITTTNLSWDPIIENTINQ